MRKAMLRGGMRVQLKKSSTTYIVMGDRLFSGDPLETYRLEYFLDDLTWDGDGVDDHLYDIVKVFEAPGDTKHALDPAVTGLLKWDRNAKKVETLEFIDEAADIPEGALRDMFASAALTGILAHPGQHNPEQASQHAYKVADAMMGVRDAKED